MISQAEYEIEMQSLLLQSDCHFALVPITYRNMKRLHKGLVFHEEQQSSL